MKIVYIHKYMGFVRSYYFVLDVPKLNYQAKLDLFEMWGSKLNYIMNELRALYFVKKFL